MEKRHRKEQQQQQQMTGARRAEGDRKTDALISLAKRGTCCWEGKGEPRKRWIMVVGQEKSIDAREQPVSSQPSITRATVIDGRQTIDHKERKGGGLTAGNSTQVQQTHTQTACNLLPGTSHVESVVFVCLLLLWLFGDCAA